jgi:hypothetical protein
MGATDPNCEPYAHAEECERPFADEIGLVSGRVLIKRCISAFRGNPDKIMLGVRFSSCDPGCVKTPRLM